MTVCKTTEGLRMLHIRTGEKALCGEEKIQDTKVPITSYGKDHGGKVLNLYCKECAEKAGLVRIKKNIVKEKKTKTSYTSILRMIGTRIGQMMRSKQ